MKRSVAVASGSEQTESYSPGDVAIISEAIKERGIDVVDVIRSLHKGGFVEEAENLLFLVKLRVSGDYLQTSAVVRDGKLISAINDPNRYLWAGNWLPPQRGQTTGDRGDPGRAGPRGNSPHGGDLRSRGEATNRLSRVRAGRTGRRPAGDSRRRRAGFRNQAVPDPRRPPPEQRASGHQGGDRVGGEQNARGALQAQCRHLIPRPDRRGPLGIGHRHRPAGEGHGGHSPERPTAAPTIWSSSPTHRSPRSSITDSSAATPPFMQLGRSPSRWWCRPEAKPWAPASMPGLP